MNFHFYLNKYGGTAAVRGFLASLAKTSLAAGIGYVLHRLDILNTMDSAALSILIRSAFSGILEYGKVGSPYAAPSQSVPVSEIVA